MNKKCAIYNRLSVKNDNQLELKRTELIKYCKDVLKIEEYELFEEVSSVLEERKEFNQMMERIEKKEFTDILVYHTDRIYKPRYDRVKYIEYLDIIKHSDVELHSIMEPEFNIQRETVLMDEKYYKK